MAEFIGQNLYIKPNYIVSVPEYDTPKRIFSAARIKNEKNLRDNKHKNKLSPKAIKRISGAVNWLCASAETKRVYNAHTKKWFDFKVNLITLTLPDTDKPITEHEFKTKLIHPFLVYCAKYYSLKNYVWKVEFQQNGKLHIHLTSDTFIHHAKIRHTWNRLLNSNGYLEDFKKKFKHENPNSTDVHAVWKVRNLAAYLAKYMSKNEQNTDIINGRIWGCNYQLSEVNKCHMFVSRDECAEDLACLMDKRIPFKEITTQDKITGRVFKQAEIFFLNNVAWSTIMIGRIRHVYEDHRYHVRHNLARKDHKETIVVKSEPAVVLLRSRLSAFKCREF